jgi:polyhydroxyalkanoate synthase
MSIIGEKFVKSNIYHAAELDDTEVIPADMALIPPNKLAEIEKRYVENIFKIWTGQKPDVEVDNRFKANIWNEGWSEVIYQTYLVNSEHLKALANAV